MSNSTEKGPWFVWPPGVDPEKYFPGAGPLTLSKETRKSGTMKEIAGGSNAVRKALGISLMKGTVHERTRTTASADTELREFFRAHKRRPTQTDLPTLDLWFRYQDSSISQRCDELGLPALLKRDRTDQKVNRELRAFHREQGRRPSSRDLQAIHKWLERRGSSLPQRCDELGIPRNRASRKSF